MKKIIYKLAALAALTLICVTGVGQPGQKSTGKDEKAGGIRLSLPNLALFQKPKIY